MLSHKKGCCWVIVMGGLWEYACFMLRTLGAFDQQNGTFVVVSTLLFLLAPLCKSFLTPELRAGMEGGDVLAWDCLWWGCCLDDRLTDGAGW
jgi:hypothetical protein